MAAPRYIAQRTDAARARIRAAAEALATRAGVDAALVGALEAYDRDPEMRLVVRQEAVAALLEALVEAKQPAEKPQDAGAGERTSPPAPAPARQAPKRGSKR